MQLTKEQIQDLYKFTRQHYVEWYDLQTELVDHLANDIEQILKQNPNVTFKEARDMAFKKFGVFGFMEVIEQKSKQLNKRYWKITLNQLKSFFSIPKIALSISLIYSLYFALYYLKLNRNVFLFMVLIISIYPVYFAIKHKIELSKKAKTTGKKYLFEEYIYNLGGLASGFILPLQFFLQIKNLHHQGSAILVSFLLVIYGLILYITA